MTEAVPRTRTPFNLAAAIYGEVTVGSVLAVVSAQSETYAETVGAAVISLVLYWSAHAYAENASERIRDGEPLTLRGLVQSMAYEMPILIGAAIPILTLIVAWAADASLSTAVTAGVWTAAGLLVAIEAVAALRTKGSAQEKALQALLGAFFGLGIILLRVLLH